MVDQPLVSVLLPAYNASKYLRRAIQSILDQSYKSFELIVINDGSTDSTWSIIESISDSRVRAINLEENQGLIAVLNYGLTLAQGPYIARMDADDVACVEKFERQIEFLEANQEYGACGTGIFNVSELGRKSKLLYPESHEKIVSALVLFERNICHPTVMIRKKVLDDYNIIYHSDYIYAEDYCLWAELAKVSKLYNLKKPLLEYQRHEGQVSFKHYPEQMNTSRTIVNMLLSQYDVLSGTNIDEVNIIDFLVHEVDVTDKKYSIEEIDDTYKYLSSYFSSNDMFDTKYSKNILEFKRFRSALFYNVSKLYKIKTLILFIMSDPKSGLMNLRTLMRAFTVYRLRLPRAR